MDNEELQKMVRETYDLTQQNNVLLKKMRRTQRQAHIWQIVYWIILIGISIGAFYYVQPYLQKVYSLYTEGLSQYNGFKDAGTNLFKTTKPQ